MTKTITIKQALGMLCIITILGATLLSVLGIWGFLPGETAIQCVVTLVITSIGLGAAGSLIDTFFKDPDKTKDEV